MTIQLSKSRSTIKLYRAPISSRVLLFISALVALVAQQIRLSNLSIKNNDDPTESLLFQPSSSWRSGRFSNAPPLSVSSRKRISSLGSERSAFLFQNPCLGEQECLSELPKWIQDFIKWQQEELRYLHAQSSLKEWQNRRILVMRCLKRDRCGGTADRLKTLPFMLAVAAHTKRLLFILWERPFPLETFLMPHRLNWTLPQPVRDLWGDKRLRYKHMTSNQMILQNAPISNLNLITTASQGDADTLYQKLVEKQFPHDDPSTSTSIFRNVFFAFFRPVPALEEKVQSKMKALQLIPNQFVSIHERAKYPQHPYYRTNSSAILYRHVKNALQCASNLAYNVSSMAEVGPAMPIFVASDTMKTMEAARFYQETENPNHHRIVSNLDLLLPSPKFSDSTATTRSSARSSFATSQPSKTRDESLDPPHINFQGFANTTMDLEPYYDVFIDWLIMSQSRCVSYGRGGYGVMGSWLTADPSCHYVHTVWKGFQKDHRSICELKSTNPQEAEQPPAVFTF